MNFVNFKTYFIVVLSLQVESLSPGAVPAPVNQGPTTLQILLQPPQNAGSANTSSIENLGPSISPQNPPLRQQQGNVSSTHTAIRSQLMVSYQILFGNSMHFGLPQLSAITLDV